MYTYVRIELICYIPKRYICIWLVIQMGQVGSLEYAVEATEAIALSKIDNLQSYYRQAMMKIWLLIQQTKSIAFVKNRKIQVLWWINPLFVTKRYEFYAYQHLCYSCCIRSIQHMLINDKPFILEGSILWLDAIIS